MKQELISKAFGYIDDCFVIEAHYPVNKTVPGKSKRPAVIKMKRFVTYVVAAVLVLVLGMIAFAVWSIHTARRQELKTDMKIDENKVTSYKEFNAADEQTSNIVLLSSVNNGQEHRVYINISPVTEEEAVGAIFTWKIVGTENSGFAGPYLPVDVSVSGKDEVREAVLENAYDKETQTLTLECFIMEDLIKTATDVPETESVSLQISMINGDDEPQTFGTVSLSPADVQARYFDFGHAHYHDKELDKVIEIAGLELTPFGAVWKVNYDNAASFHTSETDWEVYKPWSLLEEKVCTDTKIYFSDGSTFSTGGSLNCSYENGTVNLMCGWGTSIDIYDVQRIVMGDLVLWEES